MNRWHIRKEPLAPDYPYPWRLFRDNWEDIDQNTNLASIEGGAFASFEEALSALNEALRLERYVITEEVTP